MLSFREYDKGRGQYVQSILDAVGETPLIRLGRISPMETGEIYLKAEHLNPGGSHKIRIAKNMIFSAEQQGLLKRGSMQTIIEPTGGNTGIGVAMCCAVLGYRCVLVIPDNYSVEKQRLLRSYGAEIVLSDSSKGNNSHGELATKLQFDHPDWVMLNQGANPANPEVHRLVTAQEIERQLGDSIPDLFVGGVGTGGHISGIGRRLKELYPSLSIVAIQPEGCSIDDDVYVRHHIQGLAIGYSPPNFDRDIVDSVRTVTEKDAKAGMVLLMTREGIGAGISTGANIYACIKLLTEMGGGRVLTLSYDNAGDYIDMLVD